MKRIKVVLFTLLLCFSAGMSFAQVEPAFQNSETYLDVVVDSATLQTLSHDFSVDRVRRNADGTFNTRIWLSYLDYDNFLSREIPYSVVQPTRATVTMATTYAQMINGWNRYPTYNTYLAMMDTFQTRYPNLCKIDTILASTPGGRKVLCAHISNNLNDNMGKPSIFYTSTMHGDEVVGYYFMLRLIDMLLSNYNTDTRLTNMVNNFDIWICPLHNPDGTYHTSDNQVGESSISTRANYNGVDLNRSFPQYNQTIGSSNNYQPEVWAMMQFFAAHNFTLAANFHGGAEVFNYPWDAWTTSTRAHADDAWWQYVGRKFADTCQQYNSNYFTEENDGITEGGDWYVITGSMQDYHNWFLGTRHVTIEVGDKVLSSSLLPNYWGYAYHSLLNFIEEAGYGIHGTVTDARTGEPLQAMIYVNNHDADHSYVETTLPYGTYHRPIKAGTYSVTYSADGYFPQTIDVNVLDGAKLILNVQLEDTVEACKRPMDLVADNVAATTASLSWTERGTAGEWVLQYGTDITFAEGTYNVVNVTNTPAIDLVGLTTGADYYARVKAVCDAEDESAWSNICTFHPSAIQTVEIGVGGSNTSNNLPFNNYYKYSLSQQIYTTSELGDAGNIVSIDFYKNGSASSNRNLDIYMVSTAKSNFTGSKDWITVTDANKVFSGMVNFANNDWTTITLDTPFSYDGTNNVAIVVDDNTGSYVSNTGFRVFSASYQALRVYNDNTNYNIASLSSYSGTRETTKNQIRIRKEIVEPEPCLDSTEFSASACESYDWNGETYTVSGDYVKTFTNANGCDSVVTLHLTVNHGTHNAETETAHESYAWNGETYTESGTYTFEYVNEEGCESTDTLHLTVTHCTPITVSYSENFDSYSTSTTPETGAEPDCWEVIEEYVSLSASTKPQVYRGFATSGDYSLRLRNRCMYAMPALDEGIAGALTMTFSLRQPKTAYRLQVGLLDEDGNFELVATLNNASTGIETVSVDFTGYELAGRRIAFKNVLRGQLTYDYSYNYIDDIVLSYAQDAVCGINSLSWDESFEGYATNEGATGVEPDCWEVVTEDVALDASTRPQLYAEFNTTAGGHYTLRMRNRCVYAMPELSSDIDVNTLTMTFQLRQPKTFYRLQVGVVDADSNFELVEEINNATLEMEPVSVDFADYTGTGHRIAFRNVLKGKRYEYSYNYIDDIRINYTANIVEEAKSESDMPEGADAEYLERIAVYPNPTTGELYIDAVAVQKVECYNQMGQLVGVYDNVNELNIGELADGVYMLRITVPQGVTMRKVVKR